MIRVYLAGGWFTPSQNDRYSYVEETLKSLGFEVFSPRSVKLPDSPTDTDMENIFKLDIDEIRKCDFMVNITNEKDMGTLFEAGYAWANGVPIVYFAENLNGPFNLMLAKTAAQVITSREDLKILSDKSVVYNILSNAKSNYVGEVE